MLLKERVNENACGELPSQERMRDVNTFFFFWRRIRSVDRIALRPVVVVVVVGEESK